MQSHVHAGKIIESIPVRLNSGGFVALTFGHAEIYAESIADCDEIIKAATEARDLLSPIWAVTDSLEGQVAGPVTRAYADEYVRDNGSYFTGKLTVGRAVDAKLSPPAPGTLSDAERAEATTPPGHQLPAGDVPGNGIVCVRFDEPAGTDAS